MCGLHLYSRMGASGFACSVAVLSDQLDGKGKHVTDTTLGSYDARRTWVVLELAPEPKDLHVDAAIEHVFVNSRRLQEMLTGERSLRRIEECSQKRVLAFRQCDRGAARVRQASRATIELPTAKSAATLLQLLSRGDATRLPPTQYSPDARDAIPRYREPAMALPARPPTPARALPALDRNRVRQPNLCLNGDMRP